MFFLILRSKFADTGKHLFCVHLTLILSTLLRYLDNNDLDAYTPYVSFTDLKNLRVLWVRRDSLCATCLHIFYFLIHTQEYKRAVPVQQYAWSSMPSPDACILNLDLDLNSCFDVYWKYQRRCGVHVCVLASLCSPMSRTQRRRGNALSCMPSVSVRVRFWNRRMQRGGRCIERHVARVCSSNLKCKAIHVPGWTSL